MEGQEKRAGGRNQLYDYGPLQPESNQQQNYGTVQQLFKELHTGALYLCKT